MNKGNTALAWVIIVLGGLFQIGWAIGLDYTNGFTDPLWDAAVLVFLVLSMICLSRPMDMGISFSTAYAVWIGLGVVGTIAVSAILGLETINIAMVLCLMVTIAGVVGLKMTPVEKRIEQDE